MRELPDRIYARHDADDEDATYLLADETTDGIEDGETVGIYHLVEIKKMTVTRKLQ